MLEYLRFCPRSDPRFPHLIEEVTRNFDKFPDATEQIKGGGKAPIRVERSALDNKFAGYTYKRKMKPTLPISGQLFDDSQKHKAGL